MRIGRGGAAAGGRSAPVRPAVDATLMWTFLGIRGFVLAQSAVALSTGTLTESGGKVLSAALMAAVAVESVVLGAGLARRRSLAPAGWQAWADIALAVVVLALVPVYITAGAGMYTWTMWPYPVTLTTAVLAGAALRRLGPVLAVSGALGLTYALVTAVPMSGNALWRGTAVVNSLAFLGFAALTFLMCRFVRELASAADAARVRVAELEQDRSRALVHDLLVYLRLDQFATASDEARRAMTAAALARHDRLRSWVDGTGGPQTLGERVQAVLRSHPALAVHNGHGAGHDGQLPGEVLDQVEIALDTALANVEQHAPGARVGLTVRWDADRVTLEVRDDGPGFDQASTRPGFGVAEVLGRQLAAVGGSGSVESGPGAGTLVTITVPRTLS